MSIPVDIEGVFRAEKLESQSPVRWDLEMLRGRLVEISGTRNSGRMTAAFNIIESTHRDTKLAAWISIRQQKGIFFPPDAARTSIDLNALPVIRAETIDEAGFAAGELLACGGLRCVVIDNPANESVSRGLLKRLSRYIKEQSKTLIFLTGKPINWSRLSPMISLRVDVSMHRSNEQCHCRIEPIVDKNNGPSWQLQETYNEAPGLY